MNLVHIAGWTLVHSVWEFAVVAVGLLAARAVCANPRVRYVLGLMALALCLIAPAATVIVLAVSTPAHLVFDSSTAGHALGVSAAGPIAPRFNGVIPSPTIDADGFQIESLLPLFVRLWAIGLAIMSLRFLFAVFAIEQLKRKSEPYENGQIEASLKSLVNQFDLRKRIEIRVSHLIESPITVGIFRTMIFLPASTVSGMSGELLEAILAHEIAHISRYDYLANLAQSLVEAIFFYHPAIWWMSHTVRAERENRCDDLAIQVLGDKTRYTRSLVLLEELRLGSPRLSVAATGGSLLSRVRRLVGGPQRSPRITWIYALIAGLVLVSLGVAQITVRRSNAPKTPQVMPMRGTVVNVDGTPAVGAIVEGLYDDTQKNTAVRLTTQTAKDGTFDFGRKTSHETVFAVLPSVGAAMGSLREKSIRLEALKNVAVRTTDSSGKPVAGVPVAPEAVVNNGGGGLVLDPKVERLFSRLTGKNGVANLSLPPENVTMEVLDDHYAIESSMQPTITPGRSGSLSLLLGRAASVKGTVTLNGNPVPHVPIFGMSRNYVSKMTETDSEGHFLMVGLPDGEYVIKTILPPNLKDEWCVPMVYLKGGQGAIHSVEIKLVPGVSVSGTISDDRGRLTPNSFLTIDSIDRPTDLILPLSTYWMLHLDSAGSFATKLPPGTYRARVGIIGNFNVGKETTFSVTRGQPMVLNLAGPEAPRVIHCRVIGPDGKPAGAGVRVEWSFRNEAGIEQRSEADTNAQGLADASIVSTIIRNPSFKAPKGSNFGHWEGEGRSDASRVARGLSFHASKGDEFSSWGVIPNGDEVELRLQRIPLASVTGIVQDSRGRPLQGVAVQLGFNSNVMYMGDGEKLAKPHVSKADGTYRIDGVYPGNIVLTMFSGKGLAKFETEGVRVISQSQMMPTIRLFPARTFKGRVIDQHGKPIVNAQVIPRSDGWFVGGEPRTDKQGRFSIDDLPPRKLSFTVYRGYTEFHLMEKAGTDATYVVKD